MIKFKNILLPKNDSCFFFLRRNRLRTTTTWAPGYVYIYALPIKAMVLPFLACLPPSNPNSKPPASHKSHLQHTTTLSHCPRTHTHRRQEPAMAPPSPPRRAALLLLSLLLLSAVAQAARESPAVARSSRGHAELRGQRGEVRRASSIYLCSMPCSSVCSIDLASRAAHAWR